MKLLYLAIALLASCVLILVASASSEEQDTTSAETNAAEFKRPWPIPQQQNKPPDQGVRLISFEATGKDIAVGLDYLVPFIEVPVKRKRNAPAKPLLIVNTAAVLSSGLVGALGIFVGYLIRSFGLETYESEPEPKNGNHSSEDHSARGLFNDEQSLLRLFDNFKLVYRNESGERVETAMPSLFDTIERTFLENDVNLAVCMLKSICALTRKANANVLSGQATQLEHVLDSATSWSWLLAWLDQSALRQAIEAGKVAAPHNCSTKYPRCKWETPEDQLLDLVRKNIEFD